MPRAALLAVALLLLIAGATAWLLMGSEPADPEALHIAANGEHVDLAPGTLTGPISQPGSGTGEAQSTAPSRTEVEPEPEAAAAPIAWYRGRLRIVEGQLRLPPVLSVSMHASDGALVNTTQARVLGTDLSFEIPVTASDWSCLLRFPDHLEPLAAAGGASLQSGVVTLPAPADGYLVDVKVKPHLAVQFLHDPSDLPLASASVTTRLEENGSSTSWGEQLDDQGMLIFDFERRSNMESAKWLSFTVTRPPDVGSSQSALLPCSDLELLPQPLILRFPSTASLRFRILDPDRQPLNGAKVRLGGHWEKELSGEDGRISALQSSPPSLALVVEATGYLTTEESVTGAAAAPEGQDVQLWPGSWILIVGTEKPVEGWGQLDVEILFDGEADGSLLSQQRFATGRFTESSGSTGITSYSDKQRFKCTTALSSQGRAKLDGIHVDVPATVNVTYRGTKVLSERVAIHPGDGEHRLEVPALPELLPLRGRVTDLGGHPLDGVEVRAHFSDRDSTTVESSTDGSFDLGGVPDGAQVSLAFYKPGFGRKQVEQFVEARDTDSVGIVVLTPGRTMIVQVLDAEGAPFVAKPGTYGSDFKPRVSWAGERFAPADSPTASLGPGEWQFNDLPDTEVTILLPGEWMWDEVEHVVSTAQPRVVLSLSVVAMTWLMEVED